MPHLDALDNHLALLLPGRVPLLLSVPEVMLGGGRSVDPRLASLSVREPAIGAADSHVHNQIEVLVERRGIAQGGGPWVGETTSGAVGSREVAAVPERLIEVDVNDLQKPGVEVHEEVLLAPLETIDVEAGRPGCVESRMRTSGVGVSVVVGIRTPM